MSIDTGDIFEMNDDELGEYIDKMPAIKKDVKVNERMSEAEAEYILYKFYRKEN